MPACEYSKFQCARPRTTVLPYKMYILGIKRHAKFSLCGVFSNCSRVNIKRRIRNTDIKSSKSSPQVLLSHCSQVNIKRRMRNTDIKSSKSSPNVLLSHCSQVNIKRRMRNTNIKSSKFIKIITTGLVVTLQPGQHQKKDQEHRHQITKIHQNHHQRSCCHIAARSTSKEGSGT